MAFSQVRSLDVYLCWYLYNLVFSVAGMAYLSLHTRVVERLFTICRFVCPYSFLFSLTCCRAFDRRRIHNHKNKVPNQESFVENRSLQTNPTLMVRGSNLMPSTSKCKVDSGYMSLAPFPK